MKRSNSTRVSRWIACVALSLALLTALFDLPNRITAVANALPTVRLLLDPDEQYRLQLGAVPYDLLRAADAALPRDATVLLVTPGRDIGTLEYIIYHRALYFLAPRALWWAAPTPPDGTWKSHWWLPTPLTPQALRELAAAKGASYLLVFDVAEPLPLGVLVLERPGGYLLQLDGSAPTPTRPPGPPSYAGALWPLGLLLAVAVPMMLGGVALQLAERLGYRATGIEALSLAWALGAGLLTLLMLFLNALGIGLVWQMVLAVAVAGFGLLSMGRPVLGRWRSQRRLVGAPQLQQDIDIDAGVKGGGVDLAVRRPRARGAQYLQYLQYLLLALLAVQFVLAGALAVGRPLNVWDSWVNWGVKSRSIFLEGHISPAVYADASRAVTHLDYPLLAPLLQSWFYGWVGAPDDRFAGVASVLFYGALAGISYATVRGRGGSRLLSLGAATTLATLSHVAGLASIVFAEMPLAVFATVTGVYLLKWLQGGPPGALLISALGAGLLCWTKRDGVLFLAAVLLAATLLGWRHPRAWQGAGALIVGTLLVSGPWYAFAAANSIPAPDFDAPGVSALAANLGRWRTIIELELKSLTNHNWSYIWPLAALSGLSYWVTTPGPGSKPAWAAFVPVLVAIHLALSGAVYFFSAFVPYEQHILSSLDRLIVQVAPLVVICIALQAAPLTAGLAHSAKPSND